MRLKLALGDPTTIFDDENSQLKVGNYEFGEGPDFITPLPPRMQREYLNKSRDHKKEITKINFSNIETNTIGGN